MGGEHDLPVDNAAFVCVIVDFAVPLICQLFAASVGGSSYRRAAFAPLDNLDRTMKYCYKN